MSLTKILDKLYDDSFYIFDKIDTKQHLAIFGNNNIGKTTLSLLTIMRCLKINLTIPVITLGNKINSRMIYDIKKYSYDVKGDDLPYFDNITHVTNIMAIEGLLKVKSIVFIDDINMIECSQSEMITFLNMINISNSVLIMNGSPSKKMIKGLSQNIDYYLIDDYILNNMKMYNRLLKIKKLSIV